MTTALPFIYAFLTAASVVMTYQQGQAAKKQRAKQAAMEEANARDEQERRAFEIRQQQRRDYMRQSAIKASAGKMGVGLGGSALDVLADVVHQGVLERQEITRLGEARERNFADKAGMYRAAGKAESRAYTMQAATQLLSGGADTIVAFDNAGYFD